MTSCNLRERERERMHKFACMRECMHTLCAGVCKCIHYVGVCIHVRVCMSVCV